MMRALQVLVAVGPGSMSFGETCTVLGRPVAEQTSWALGAYSFREAGDGHRCREPTWRKGHRCK